MRLDRTGNTKRNIITGEIDRFVGIILPFIVRTMIIHLMGAEYLGLTGLYYSIVQMLNLAELGFGTAIVYSMYKPIAENDARMINALLKFYAKVYRIVGFVTTLIGLLIMPFLPELVHGDVPGDVNIYLVFLVFLGNSFLNCMLFPNRRALLAAHQRDDLNGTAHIITQVVLYGLQILSIGLARSYWLYILTIPVSTCLYSCLCARSARLVFGEYREEGELPEEEYRSIRKQVGGLIIRKTASLTRNAFDSMFISAFLGLTVTAVYGNYYYVMDAVVMILAVLKTSMAGGVGNSIAMDGVEKNLKDMECIDFLFMLISGWCAAALLCLIQPFMKLWAGEDMLLPTYMAVTFAVYFYVLKMSDIRTLYSESAGIWWQMRYLSIAEALANLLMNWIFIRFFGLFGIIAATLISYFAFNYVGGAFALYRHYFIGFPLRQYFWRHLRYALVTAGITGGTYFICTRIPAEGFMVLIARGLICALLPPAAYFLVYRKTEEFQGILPMIRKLIKR